jgi:hypothetical protein
MKSTGRMKENLFNTVLVKKMKKEDHLELPMDEKFYQNMHDKIMSAVEKTDVKPVSRWAKTWIFLETKAKSNKPFTRKIIKTSFIGFVLSMALGLATNNIKNDTESIIEIDIA